MAIALCDSIHCKHSRARGAIDLGALVGLYFRGCFRGSMTIWLERLDVLGCCMARNAIAAEALKHPRPIGTWHLNGLTAIGTQHLDSSVALGTRELYGSVATSAWGLYSLMAMGAWALYSLGCF